MIVFDMLMDYLSKRDKTTPKKDVVSGETVSEREGYKVAKYDFGFVAYAKVDFGWRALSASGSLGSFEEYIAGNKYEVICSGNKDAERRIAIHANQGRSK